MYDYACIGLFVYLYRPGSPGTYLLLFSSKSFAHIKKNDTNTKVKLSLWHIIVALAFSFLELQQTISKQRNLVFWFLVSSWCNETNQSDVIFCFASSVRNCSVAVHKCQRIQGIMQETLLFKDTKLILAKAL